MNLELFEQLWKQGRPSQHSGEWRTFLQLCESYLKKREIRHPIVVELGLFANAQKKFYEQLLGAEHIGINIDHRRCNPDILGNTHYPGTLKRLKEKLNGKSINILFIDAGHTYRAVENDFEMYSPLCNDIVAFHDINLGRRGKEGRKGELENRQVWKFWDKLKKGGYKDFSFISIEQREGIGVMMRK